MAGFGAVSPSRGGHRGGELLARDPAAERHRRAPHGPRAQQHDPGLPGPLSPHARPRARSGSSAPITPASPPRRRSSARSRARGRAATELGREPFVQRVWEWRQQYGGTIIEQLKRLGASADYAEERFTLDEAYAQAVLQGVRGPVREGLHLPRPLHGQLGPGHAARRSPTSRSSRARSPTPSTTSTIRWPRARARSRWPPSGPRRCSPTPRSPCTPRTSATGG